MYTAYALSFFAMAAAGGDNIVMDGYSYSPIALAATGVMSLAWLFVCQPVWHGHLEILTKYSVHTTNPSQ